MKEGVNKVYLMAELMTEYFQLIDLLLCRQWKMYPKICFLKEDVRAKNLADRYIEIDAMNLHFETRNLSKNNFYRSTSKHWHFVYAGFRVKYFYLFN